MDWFYQNVRLEAALTAKGYDVNHTWANEKRLLIRPARVMMFQSHVAMVSTNQAYGGGTMIGSVPAQILAHCPPKEEAYISSVVDFAKVRKARKFSRNFQQRRPDLYGVITVKGSSDRPE